ncbi:MAG: RNA-binding protein [candidate division Zixibacteria bacterium RBG_16_50_21]|nr:MAG: RNA-binding protein [candidate division Zixibacteria bacterium RBG_16_50_21]
MKEFIEYIVKNLVDHPDQVTVNEMQGEKTTVYELRCGQGDLGKVIGKKGQTAKSIRTLVTAVSAKRGKRAVVEILE